MDERLEAAGHMLGPWSIGELDDFAVIIAPDADDPDSPWYVARMGKACGFPATDEANARLIAAAPELLEALRPFAALLDALEKMGGTAPKTGEWYGCETASTGMRTITMEDFGAARAAIAKAEGRS